MKMPEMPDIPTDNLYKFMALFGLVLIVVSFVPKYYWYQFSIEKIRFSGDLEKSIMRAKEIFVKDHIELVRLPILRNLFSFNDEVLLHVDEWFDTQGGNKFDELFHGEAKDLQNKLKIYSPFAIDLEMSGLEGEALIDFYKGIRKNAKKLYRDDIVEKIFKTEDEALIAYLREIRWEGTSIYNKDVVGFFVRIEEESNDFYFKKWEVPEGSTYLDYKPVATEEKEYDKFLDSYLQTKSKSDEIQMKEKELAILQTEMYSLRIGGFLVCILGFYFWYLKLQRYQDMLVRNKALPRDSKEENPSEETENVSTTEIIEENPEPENRDEPDLPNDN